MEIEKSSGDDDKSNLSENNTWTKDEEEAHTVSKYLEVLQHEAILTHQRTS